MVSWHVNAYRITVSNICDEKSVTGVFPSQRARGGGGSGGGGGGGGGWGGGGGGLGTGLRHHDAHVAFP